MTEQNYALVRDSTTLIEQTEDPTPSPVAGLPDLIINPQAFLLQTRLIDLADKFAAADFEMGPMQAIGNLLAHWQCTPITELSEANNDDQLHCASLLADFLDELLIICQFQSKPQPIAPCQFSWYVDSLWPGPYKKPTFSHV